MRVLLILSATLTLSSATALAEKKDTFGDASRAPLGSFTPAERGLLAPYLERGPVVLTEFRNRKSDLPAIVYMARVAAPASTVAEVIANPGGYPRFMKALDAIKVTSKRQHMVSYDWSWRISIFTLHGQNVLTSFATNGDSRRGYRFDVRSTGGDLGKGRMMWRVYPDGPGRSLMILSSRIDMRDANYITRQLASGGNSVNRTINITLASVMLLETKAEAERRAGTFVGKPAAPQPLYRPRVDISALSRLLRRGDLVMMDLEGETLHQVTVLGRSGARTEPLRRVMTDPEEFGTSLVHGSRATVTERNGNRTRFKWKIPLPLVGVGGEMMLRTSRGVVSVDGISGSFSEGRWRFDTHRFPGGEAGVIGWAKFDPADSAKLVRRLIDDDATFSHGLATAMQVMVVRSLRSRVRHLRRTASAGKLPKERPAR